MTTIYHYDPITGAYMGNGQAQASPLEPGVWMIPAYATIYPPPSTGEGEIALFNEAEDAWTRSPDLRGQHYWLEDGSEHSITAIGQTVPAGAVTEKPEALRLAEARGVARVRLRTETRDRITGGISSAALGSTHSYQSALTDQANLSAWLLAALRPDVLADTHRAIWCSDSEGVAVRREHDVAQLRQLAHDLEQHIQAAQEAHEQALARLDGAATADEIAAVRLDG